MPGPERHVHDDMQIITHTSSVEHMLESADHLIERHQEGPANRYGVSQTPPLPSGWVLYSTWYATEGGERGWHVELLDTSKPFQNGSIVDGHSDSFDTALRDARALAVRN